MPETKQQQFFELYFPVQKDISNYCRIITSNGADAHDLMQDTILLAYEGFEKLKNTASFKFYLCSIARNIYFKSRRRLKYNANATLNEIDLRHSILPDAEKDLDVQMLYKAMSHLPIEQREALVMFEIMGFSLDEIRQHQGGSLSGVKSRVTRGRQKLSEMLGYKETAHHTIVEPKNALP